MAIVNAACLSSQLLLPNPFATTTVNLVAVEQEENTPDSGQPLLLWV